MKLIKILIFFTFFSAAFANGKVHKTTRPKLKVEKAPEKPTSEEIKVSNGDIVLSGYEKAQNSSTESLFVTNYTERLITSIVIKIEYFDAKNRMINSQTVTVKRNIEPGTTIQHSFRAWDRQHLWYYKNTQAKHNEYCTPFDVKVHISHVNVKIKE